MRFIIFFLILFSCKSGNQYQWISTLAKPWQINQKQYDQILPKFFEKFPDFDQRLKAINFWRLGTPYGIFKSGEEKEPDLDPILRIDTTDCTIHVLTSIAMSTSKTWVETKKKMVDIHYKINENGIKSPDYSMRWHYTSDRITNNPYTVNITKNIIPLKDLQEVELTLNKKDNGSEFLDLNWTLKNKFAFIPTGLIDQAVISKLPDVCGVAFIKKSYMKNGILIAHEGFVINNEYLIHASSNQKKTVKENLIEYLNPLEGSKFDGVMFYKITAG